jgi:hypothetical protein
MTNDHDIRQSVAHVPEVGTHVTVWYDAKEQINYEDPAWYKRWLATHPITRLIDILKRK